jgi:uncharacterized protein YpmB
MAEAKVSLWLVIVLIVSILLSGASFVYSSSKSSGEVQMDSIRADVERVDVVAKINSVKIVDLEKNYAVLCTELRFIRESLGDIKLILKEHTGGN